EVFDTSVMVPRSTLLLPTTTCVPPRALGWDNVVSDGKSRIENVPAGMGILKTPLALVCAPLPNPVESRMDTPTPEAAAPAGVLTVPVTLAELLVTFSVID